MANRTTGLVSIIVPVFNGERFVREALDSALAQTYEPVELVVVDDGSTDLTPAILAGYGDRIRAVRQENLGPSSARNAGLADSSGEFVQFLDADDLLPDDKIARQVEYLAGHPDVGVVYCEGRRFREAGPAPGPVPGGGRIREGDILSSLLERNFISTPHCTLVRRACLEDVGGFRADLVRCEDWDLWLRLARRGVRFGFIPDMWVACRIRADSLSADRIPVLGAHAKVLDSVWKDWDDRASPDARGIARHLSNAWYDYGAALMTAGRPREGRRAMSRSLAVGSDRARSAGIRLHILLSRFLPGDACRRIIVGLHRFWKLLAPARGSRNGFRHQGTSIKRPASNGPA